MKRKRMMSKRKRKRKKKRQQCGLASSVSKAGQKSTHFCDQREKIERQMTSPFAYATESKTSMDWR